MELAKFNARQYHLLARVALWLLASIVVSGAAVRLTGSGLGCSDWPNCEPGQLIPAADIHAWVEFGNRLVTGLVSVAVVLAVLGSPRRVPRNSTLTKWSIGLVVGVIAQIILGAITVMSHLSPPIVMGHFLLSMVLVWNAVVLVARADPVNLTRGAVRVSKSIKAHAQLIAAFTMVVIFTGTVVTASGPHGGDEHVERLNFSFPEVARIHGAAVIVLVVLTSSLMFRVRRTNADGFRRRVLILLVITLSQAAIGYTQYFTKLPVLLVAFHIAGATLLWIATVRLLLSSQTRFPKAGLHE